MIDSSGSAKAITDMKLNGIWEVGEDGGDRVIADDLFRVKGQAVRLRFVTGTRVQ